MQQKQQPESRDTSAKTVMAQKYFEEVQLHLRAMSRSPFFYQRRLELWICSHLETEDDRVSFEELLDTLAEIEEIFDGTDPPISFSQLFLRWWRDNVFLPGAHNVADIGRDPVSRFASRVGIEHKSGMPDLEEW